MSDEDVSCWALLYPAGLGLLIALVLRFWGLCVQNVEDEDAARARIEGEYCSSLPWSGEPDDLGNIHPGVFKMKVEPSQDERIRCRYRGVIFAAFVPPFFLYWYFQSSSVCSFFAFVIGTAALAGSIQQFWRYLRWQDKPGDSATVDFKLDHLIVRTAYGDRRVYVYDGSMQVMVSCEQDLIGIWPLQVHHRTEVVLSIKDNSGIYSFPFTGRGCGPLLARFRQSGVKVDVLEKTLIQMEFAMFTERVDPSWIAPPTKQSSRSRGTFRDMVCSGCGAKTAVPSQGTNKSCEYCGSADLTPA
jgi:ribosomal protein S27E